VSRSGKNRARPRLRALAARLGIVPSYVDQTGRETRYTSDATREALLGVMGFDAPTEDAAAGWLDELDHLDRETILVPVRVVERDSADVARVRPRLPPGVASADVTITLREEAGHTWTARALLRRSGRGEGAGTIELPTHVPMGYHTLTADLRAGGRSWRAEQSLIVVPRQCESPDAVLGSPTRGVAGVVANLYATRREEDWGVGDFTTLMQLVEWAAQRGLAFVGVNPLHALFNRGPEISPYSPVSRLFRNPIYIDVERVPEFARSHASSDRLRHLQSTIRDLRESREVDYDRVIAVKLEILTLLHRAFREGGRSSAAAVARGRDYDAFVASREPELSQYAAWMAIAEASGAPDWRAWPESMRDPDGPVVRAFRDANADRIDFHRWLQFEASRQLSDVAQRANTLGMPIGVYQDLAVGTSPGGSDTWANPALFLTGASIGAPPDPYAEEGQMWGLPPMAPHVLRAQRYRYWIQVLRRAFEHAGALRIDHILGLFHTFWIPDGGTGRDGAFVRFPTRDMLGILALESVRHGAIVVGEDLGTVPKEVPSTLRRLGILSSRVLYFERTAREFRKASSYPALSLATANTHDLPTLAGFWAGRDIELRRDLGLITKPREVKRAFAARETERKSLLKLLRLPAAATAHRLGGEGEASHNFARTFTTAVHDFLCSTRSKLVGLSLDDLMAEREPVNLPGVSPDRWPSWRRRSRMTVEALSWSFEADTALGCEKRRTKK
jgi:4-alpha-glucanotransferase